LYQKVGSNCIEISEPWFVSVKNKMHQFVACPDYFGIPTHRNKYHEGDAWRHRAYDAGITASAFFYQIASAYFPKEVLCLLQSPRNDEDSDKRSRSQSHGVFVIARPAHKTVRM